ncbi:MAG: HNH endonuclease [Ktedonobacteraceae bacterium]
MPRVIALSLAAIIVFTSSAFAGEHDLPDLKVTPGAAILGITADDVCSPGYAAKARHVTQEVRQQVYAAYGLTNGNHTGYCSGREGCELDHLISLELGGSNDANNLWVEPYEGEWGAHTKDRLESKLHEMVCAGKISLKEAQHDIASDWIAAYHRYVEQSDSH